MPITTSVLERFNEAAHYFRSRDIANYTNYLAEEVEMWLPFGLPIKGKEVCKASLDAHINTLIVGEMRNVTAEEYGEMAIVTCLSTWKDKLHKNMLIWRKYNGVWFIYRDLLLSAEHMDHPNEADESKTV